MVEVIADPWRAGAHRAVNPVSAANLHLIHHGGPVWQWQDRLWTVAAKTLLWIPAGQATGWHCRGQDVGRCTLHLRSGAWAPSHPADAEAIAIMQQLDRLVMQHGPELPCTNETVERIDETLKHLAVVYAAPDLRHHRSFLKAGAMTVLGILDADATLNRLISETPPSTVLRATDRIKVALQRLTQRDYFCQADLRVTDLAKLCGYRPAYFHTLFVEATGTTPQRYLTQRRIAYACDLLAHSDQRIIDIAFACGFNAQSRFYHAFVAIMGMPPGRWRQQSTGILQ